MSCYAWLQRHCRPPPTSDTFAQRIKQTILARKGSNTLDITTLLLCPDPARCHENSYKVLDALGQGGFGVVHKAVYLPTGEERAIKVIPKQTAPDAARVMAEVQALIQLDHPNIMKFHEYFEDAKQMYVVTELCLGGDFGTLDAEVDDLDEIRLLFRDLVSAVAYCHSEGIAHRDLKFQNVLLQPGEGNMRRVAKVIDFGLAAIRKPGEHSEAWMDDTVGTVFYMAPEVVKVIEKPDLSHWYKYGMQCDMWSIGIMLYIILTDQHPFAATAMSAKVAAGRIMRRAVPLQPLDDCDVDPDARDLILKLLVKDPQHRLTAADALDHLWFQDQPSLQSRTMSGISRMRLLIDRVISFSRFSKFEQALLTLVAHDADRREIDDLRSTFNELDTKKAGWLSPEGIQVALLANSVHLSDEDFDAVLLALDPDKDNKIQYTDWIAATIRASTITTMQAAQKLFTFFDISGHGKVSRKDMELILGKAVTAEVFVEADKSESEDFSEEDFRMLLLAVGQRLEVSQRENSMHDAHVLSCSQLSQSCLPGIQEISDDEEPELPSTEGLPQEDYKVFAFTHHEFYDENEKSTSIGRSSSLPNLLRTVRALTSAWSLQSRSRSLYGHL